MSMFHQEVDTVFFERDRVGIGLGNALDHLYVFDVELVAAGGALVGADLSANYDARFLRQTFQRLEDRGRHAFDVGHALHGSSAVAKDGKEKLAAFTRVIEPSMEGDGLAFMLAQGRDGGKRSGGFGCF